MKVNESIKTIFYLLHYASLLKQANFKTDHAHLSKLCLLKRVILVNKQHFGIFEPSNNCNKVNKSIKTNFFLAHHASSLKEANFKTDHAYLSNLCLLKRVILVKKQHFLNF